MSDFLGIGFEVQAKGLDEQLRKFERYPQITQPRLVNAMNDSLLMVEAEGKRLAPVGVTGELRSSIGSKVTHADGTDVQGVVGASAPHAAVVETGSRAHWPPIANIAYWVDRKLQVQDAFAIYGIALAVARKIAAKGTRKHPYLKPGYQAKKTAVLQRFQKAVDQIAKDLEVR